MPHYIVRTGAANTVVYTYRGDRITNHNELSRIESLPIPPAWKDVAIARSTRAKVQAFGTDSAGRTQYIYSPAFRAKQEAKKFERIILFGKKLPKLRRQLEKDLHRRRFDKRKVLSCAVSLMDQTYFRVGNEQYAQAHKSYGLTTLRSKHIEVQDDGIVFDFIGKSGQHQHKKVTDRTLAHYIKKLDDIPGYELFRYYGEDNTLHNLTSADINQYLKSVMGQDFSAKDFRTWGGTLVACMELSKLQRPNTEEERKKAIASCVKRVAKKLGNTPAVTRSSYIDPRVLEMFDSSNALSEMYATVAKIKESDYFSSDEQCAMNCLSAQ